MKYFDVIIYAVMVVTSASNIFACRWS